MTLLTRFRRASNAKAQRKVTFGKKLNYLVRTLNEKVTPNRPEILPDQEKLLIIQSFALPQLCLPKAQTVIDI